MKPTAYIASPFFTPEQVKQVEHIKQELKAQGFAFFSPKDSNLVTSKSTKEELRYAFNTNLSMIIASDFIIANIEGIDQGTYFEIGYAYAVEKPVLLWSPNPVRKLNLMLQQAATIFAASASVAPLIRMYVQKEEQKYQGEIE